MGPDTRWTARSSTPMATPCSGRPIRLLATAAISIANGSPLRPSRLPPRTFPAGQRFAAWGSVALTVAASSPSVAAAGRPCRLAGEQKGRGGNRQHDADDGKGVAKAHDQSLAPYNIA